ncbi:GNAT family N-acetyltransferase [Galbibacter sp. EGI 63066]|uniref:GNAT family N-acetyltransferase n=1 Tax=Galbibacter sp. EGI 63066 TaxID=2993559 RepID=UPI002249464C|nr:GNAT family N-acetyltransferase [Galbibacter sp. EGI 63066]MCX2681094.1 GNAT family N-acetyltransferase [Galbibacter sp. EGI 63066]
MKYTIRTAVKEDMNQVLELIRELAIFEKEPDAVEVTVADLQRDGFGDKPAFHCFVAEADNKIEGIALVYDRYSTWKGKTIHLEDLIVRESRRGTGLGSALFAQVIQYGHEQGVKRIEWAVLDWNDPAINFYEKNGANVMRDWDTVQLDEEGIKNFIAKNNL